LPLLAGANISADFVKATVANCIDIVVHCEMLETGQRRVSQIAEVKWVAATESPSVELIDMGRSD
jgi:Flp pilus assembly CpaF family ATPase